MAPATLTRAWWWVGALLAAGTIATLAFHGERPGAGLSRYEPRGVMLDIPPTTVSAVEVLRDGRRWRFARDGGGSWRAGEGSPGGAADPTQQLELGLRFLHGSAPQRAMDDDESAHLPLADAGLAPPRLTLTITSAGHPPFVVELGGPNPQGLARYARVGGQVVLLNRYVADPWEKVTAAP